MPIAEWIAHYGSQYAYVAVAVGTFLEGEAALLVATFLAWRGHLELPNVIAVAIVSTFLGDFVHYYAGRRCGPALLRRFPSLAARTRRASRLMHRHHLPLILSMRFFYGVRSAGLVMLGMSGVPVSRFIVCDLLGSIVWAIAIAAGVYLFGSAAERAFAQMSVWQLWLAGSLLLLMTAAWLLSRRRRLRIPTH